MFIPIAAAVLWKWNRCAAPPQRLQGAKVVTRVGVDLPKAHAVAVCPTRVESSPGWPPPPLG
jgi:hypothetical protein